MGPFQIVDGLNVVFLKGRSLDHSFFLVYINDLPNCLSYCTQIMFTDNKTLTVRGKSTQDLSFAMNHNLDIM